ncbi:hypothetical protein [Pseudofrankia sp. DC12]|uniref:hypothetical protein n=1 Tax=Pseudofrankia sp. DC12 TaxID=683315 RepID=UPI001E3DDB0F|nr:hypothetical protein [Pseudofrankia sp. DC12]
MTEHEERWGWPTGGKVTLPFVSVQRIEDSVITLWRDYWDFRTLLAAAPPGWQESMAFGDPRLPGPGRDLPRKAGGCGPAIYTEVMHITSCSGHAGGRRPGQRAGCRPPPGDGASPARGRSPAPPEADRVDRSERG